MNIEIVVMILTLSCAYSANSGEYDSEYDGAEDDDERPPRVQDIPDKYYDSLMQEIPELSQILAEFTARRNSPAYKESMHYKKPHGLRNQTTPKSGRRVYQHYPWGYTRTQSDIWWGNQFVTKKKKYRLKKRHYKSSCYWCGMNVSYFVPTTSICHDAFESQNFRMRALQRFFRGKCYYTDPIFINIGSRKNYYHQYHGTFQGWNNLVFGAYASHYDNHTDKMYKGKWGWGFYYDYGLKRNFFGQYLGGCFKRYLDVGNIYTQRGCKHYWPINTYGPNENLSQLPNSQEAKSVSSTAHRFKKLEYVLRWRKEGCVSSTHASLTPFNRGISLYARYHVCVCDSRYCNGAEPSSKLLSVPTAILLTYCSSFRLG